MSRSHQAERAETLAAPRRIFDKVLLIINESLDIGGRPFRNSIRLGIGLVSQNRRILSAMISVLRSALRSTTDAKVIAEYLKKNYGS